MSSRSRSRGLRPIGVEIWASYDDGEADVSCSGFHA
jgi:hypothetical protein